MRRFFARLNSGTTHIDFWDPVYYIQIALQNVSLNFLEHSPNNPHHSRIFDYDSAGPSAYSSDEFQSF